MGETTQTGVVATGDVSLLAYAQHMAKTARSEAAKRMFEAYVEQERQRLEANSGSRGPGAPKLLSAATTP
jgi:hypothetical protein